MGRVDPANGTGWGGPLSASPACPFTLSLNRSKMIWMARIGRPTNDPKKIFLGLRLAERDMEALTMLAMEMGVSASEAARAILRQELGVPELPKKTRMPAKGKKP